MFSVFILFSPFIIKSKKEFDTRQNGIISSFFNTFAFDYPYYMLQLVVIAILFSTYTINLNVKELLGIENDKEFFIFERYLRKNKGNFLDEPLTE